MRAILIICLLLGFLSPLKAQNEEWSPPGAVKQWQFRVHDGEMKIWLFNYPDSHDLTLYLYPEGASVPTLPEEAQLLRQVLGDMPLHGYNPDNLARISTALHKSEFQEGIERAVLKSGKWKGCERRQFCYQATPVAEKYLISVDAFKEFDVILQKYGLTRVAIHIDEMGARMKVERLLCDGKIVISLRKGK